MLGRAVFHFRVRGRLRHAPKTKNPWFVDCFSCLKDTGIHVVQRLVASSRPQSPLVTCNEQQNQSVATNKTPMMGHTLRQLHHTRCHHSCAYQPLLTAVVCAHGGCGLAAAGAIGNPDIQLMHDHWCAARALLAQALCLQYSCLHTSPHSTVLTRWAPTHHNCREGRDRHPLCSCLHKGGHAIKTQPLASSPGLCSADDRRPTPRQSIPRPDSRHTPAALPPSVTRHSNQVLQSAVEHWCCP